MDNRHINTEPLWKLFISLMGLLVVACLVLFAYLCLQKPIKNYLNKPTYSHKQLEEMARKRAIQRDKERSENWNLVEKGIHVKTGLKADPNLQVVIGACTSCHSAQLISQNKATRQGWKNMIVWMQQTQGLGDLGANEGIILDYLAKHYAPKETGRRNNLDTEAIEWYILNVEE